MGVTWERILAFCAILLVGPTVWFVFFWTNFDFLRRRRTLAYAAMASILVGWGAIAYATRHWTWFGGRLAMPVALRGVGWFLIAVSVVFGWVADRQIGLRVRSFMPFFSEHGRIELRTTGAYGIVRHPIYAAGRVFAFGVFLVTGYPSVLFAWAVWTLGSIWFSRQEERRLVALLDDPSEYDRYRERVPALFPFLRPRTPSA